MRGLTCFFVFLFFIACSQDNIKLEDSSSKSQPEESLSLREFKVLNLRDETNFIRDLQDIEDNINSVVTLLNNADEGNKLKTSERKRSVANIKVLKSSITLNNSQKSSKSDNKIDLDTLAYVVNFSENMGYVLICADKRVDEQILAICPEGSLDMTIDNPGLAIFLEHAENGIMESIKEYEQSKDSIYQNIIKNKKQAKAWGEEEEYDYEGEVYYDTKLVSANQIVEQIKPLVPVTWSQGTPFNNNVRYKGCSEGKAPAGCTNIAIAQIMAYWKFPSSFNGKNYNWNDLLLYRTPLLMEFAPLSTQQNIASLVEDLGWYMKTDYGCDDSGTKPDQMIKLLQVCGFRSTGKLQDYDFNTVLSSLKAGQPVIGRGNSGRNKVLGITVSYSGGHVWNIDGYIVAQTTYKYIAERRSRTDGAIIDRWTGTTTDSYYYHHINWGWGVAHNGYYGAYYFNANTKHSFPSDATKAIQSKDMDEGQTHNYQYNIEIIPFISK